MLSTNSFLWNVNCTCTVQEAWSSERTHQRHGSYPLGTCDLKQFRSQFVTICSNCDSVDKTKPPIQSISEFCCSLSCSDFKTSALLSLVKQNTLLVLWVSVRSSPLCSLHWPSQQFGCLHPHSASSSVPVICVVALPYRFHACLLWLSVLNSWGFEDVLCALFSAIAPS